MLDTHEQYTHATNLGGLMMTSKARTQASPNALPARFRKLLHCSPQWTCTLGVLHAGGCPAPNQQHTQTPPQREKAADTHNTR